VHFAPEKICAALQISNHAGMPPLLRFWCACLLASFSLQAAPLPSGPGRIEFSNEGESLAVFTYKPPTYRDGPLLVVCHGVQRNAEDYRNFAINLAERFGVIVVAPLFDKERFPLARYQRGGLLDRDGQPQPAERWTYAAIPRLVAHVRALEGKPALAYYLIGHSAGGQFLSRLAAFMPGEAKRIVVTNPGSHLFPDREQKFGYGFGGLPAELASDDVLRHYLAAPVTIYLGTGDVTPEHSFDASPEGMRQGPHRLARGRACFEAAQALAKARGWTCHWRKVETPGIAHEAARMFAAKEAEDALFGDN
jgi:poly(3-hydroxybutyrate) depolymerase